MKGKKKIPLAKKSKKKRKSYFAEKRGSWQGINPVTRKPEDPKVYNRAREKREQYSEGKNDVI